MTTALTKTISKGEIAQMPSTEATDTGAMALRQLVDRVNMVQHVFRTIMKDGTHYGTIPGCGQKKVLFKPGADLLSMAFRLAPSYEITTLDLGNGHKMFDVTCIIRDAAGNPICEGVGSGSTMEKKYRYIKAGDSYVERTDIADVYNTVLKMSKKRAHIDATLTATGAADIFTQDLIDTDTLPDEKRDTSAARDVLMRKRSDSTTANDDPPPPDQPEQTAQPIVVGRVEAVTEKKGLKDGKPWTRYGIKIDGTFYNTFSDTIAGVAKDAKASGDDVELEFRTNDRGFHDAVSIKRLVDEVPQ